MDVITKVSEDGIDFERRDGDPGSFYADMIPWESVLSVTLAQVGEGRPRLNIRRGTDATKTSGYSDIHFYLVDNPEELVDEAVGRVFKYARRRQEETA